MKWFLLGVMTAIVIMTYSYTIAYWAARGWYAGKRNANRGE